MVYSRNSLKFDCYHLVNMDTRYAFKVGFPQYSGIGCSLSKCSHPNLTCNFCNFCINL